MIKPTCVPCQLFYRCIKSGFLFVEGKPVSSDAKPGTVELDRWTPYKIWNGDLFRCDGCGHLTIAGVCAEPLSIDYRDDFDHWLKRVDAQHVSVAGIEVISRVTINDC